MSKTTTQGIILSLLILISGLGFFLYSNSHPSYYGQYNYRHDYAYGYGDYVYGYGDSLPFFSFSWRRKGPEFMLGTPDNWRKAGCNSYIYVNNALDYAYYTNPWLLEPRRMNNRQWMYRGLWPQQFYY